MAGSRVLQARLANWSGTIGEFSEALDREQIRYLSFSKTACVEFCGYRYLLESEIDQGFTIELKSCHGCAACSFRPLHPWQASAKLASSSAPADARGTMCSTLSGSGQYFSCE